jgi:hypothetical protein
MHVPPNLEAPSEMDLRLRRVKYSRHLLLRSIEIYHHSANNVRHFLLAQQDNTRVS